MRILVLALAAATVAAPATAQKPPREQSPAPIEILSDVGSGNSDEAITNAIAAADAHPLGSTANPVRVAGPEGERAYLARLRCANDAAPKIGSRSAAGVGAFGSVVSSYEIDCGTVAPGRTTIVMDMYHEEHPESRAPAGFRIEPR